jgi:hypothetical protein
MRVTANSFRRWLLIGSALLLVLALGGTHLFLAAKTRAAPATQAAPTAQAASGQPIAFNHQIMVQLGIQCLFCHTEARRSPAAGMPSVERCMGCHRVIATNTPEIQKVADYWNRQQSIPWVRVNALPRFVYFSHEVHVTAGGLNCERCHGDVGHMTIDRPVVHMNMGWCLSCHEQQSNAAQLRDCVVCHQ